MTFGKVAGGYFWRGESGKGRADHDAVRPGIRDHSREINQPESPFLDWQTTGAIMANHSALKARIGEAADALARDADERKRSNAALDRTLARLEAKFRERGAELEHLAARLAPLERANRDAAALIERLVGFTERCAAENKDSTVAAARRLAAEAWPGLNGPPAILRYEDVTEEELAAEDEERNAAAPDETASEGEDDDILALLRRVREIKGDTPRFNP